MLWPLFKKFSFGARVTLIDSILSRQFNYPFFKYTDSFFKFISRSILCKIVGTCTGLWLSVDIDPISEVVFNTINNCALNVKQ